MRKTIQRSGRRYGLQIHVQLDGTFLPSSKMIAAPNDEVVYVVVMLTH